MPKPILIKISFGSRLNNQTVRPIIESVTKLFVIVPSVIGYTMGGDRVPEQSLRPNLRDVIGQTCVNDLRGGTKNSETWPRKFDELEV